MKLHSLKDLAVSNKQYIFSFSHLTPPLLVFVELSLILVLPTQFKFVYVFLEKIVFRISFIYKANERKQKNGKTIFCKLT